MYFINTNLYGIIKGMKDEDVEILLDAVKDLERTLSNVEQKVLNTEEQIKRIMSRQKIIKDDVHEFRLNIDSKYKEEYDRILEGYDFAPLESSSDGDEDLSQEDKEEMDVIIETKLKD